MRVGAGAKWERVVPRLSALGLAALHGSSPDVGIAGYSLGGGMGWLARRYGLQANAVTAIELVTADGRLVRADAEHEPELFWALRGGGGNFGVVTAIEFDVYPVDELYAGALFFPFERAAEVLHAWSELLPTLPDEMMSWARVMHFPPLPDVPGVRRGRSFAIVMAAFLGSEADGRELLRPLRELGPALDTFAMVPPVVLGDLAMDPRDPLPVPHAPTRCSTSCRRRRSTSWSRGRPGSGLGPRRCSSCATWAAPSPARRRAPGRGRRCRARSACSASASSVDEAAEPRSRRALEDVDGRRAARTAAATTRTSSRSPPTRAASSTPTPGAPAGGEGALRPGDLFLGNHHIPPKN